MKNINLSNKKLLDWQELTIYRALEFDFITKSQIDEAVKIFSKFEDENDFVLKCRENTELAKALICASQI